MPKQETLGVVESVVASRWQATARVAYTNFIGRAILRVLMTIQGLIAFGLISAGVLLTKHNKSKRVIHPLIFRELARSGVRLLPMFLFISIALGLVVIGQAAVRLSQVKADPSFLGTIMVVVVVRELGPLLTAMLVLARSGVANVIELGTARALGEVEALESLGIDPIHYFVMPRIIGMALGVFALTIYLIVGALISGYAWAFLDNLPLRPGDYLEQLTNNLTYLDFAVLILKSTSFGIIIAVITCYNGLAQPIELDEVSGATIGAVGQSILACVALDAIFIILYLVT